MHKCKVNGKSVLEKQIDRQMEASATRSVINKQKYIIVNYENCYVFCCYGYSLYAFTLSRMVYPSGTDSPG